MVLAKTIGFLNNKIVNYNKLSKYINDFCLIGNSTCRFIWLIYALYDTKSAR